MKSLHIVDRLGVGGAETWLMELMRYWQRQGETAPRMDFVATSGARGAFDDEARRLGATIFYLRFGRGHLRSFTRGWRDILARNAYDAVHDHQEFVSGWHFLLGAGHLPPVRIAHVHNPMLGYRAHYGVTVARRAVAGMGWRLVERYATHLCGTSAAILRANGYEGDAARRPHVSVLHCGFDVAKFGGARAAAREQVLHEFGWPAETRLVLSVGRIDRALAFDHPQNHKNSWFALNVARVAAERDASLCYLIAGEGPGRQAMEARVAQWGLQDRIRFIGLRHDVPRLMRAADALLFPSAGEGLGMVAVEAQAAGLPVLASRAVPDECIVVPALYTAMSLSEPLQAWAEGLAKVLRQERPSIDVCRRALERSDFSIERSAAKLADIYGAAAP